MDSKLPETLRKEWLAYAADTRNSVAPENGLYGLLGFLREQESIYEQLEQEGGGGGRVEPQHGRTESAKSKQ